jgi:hypothetical protein
MTHTARLVFVVLGAASDVGARIGGDDLWGYLSELTTADSAEQKIPLGAAVDSLATTNQITQLAVYSQQMDTEEDTDLDNLRDQIVDLEAGRTAAIAAEDNAIAALVSAFDNDLLDQSDPVVTPATSVAPVVVAAPAAVVAPAAAAAPAAAVAPAVVAATVVGERSTYGFYYQVFQEPKSTLVITRNIRNAFPAETPLFMLSDQGFDFSPLACEYNFTFEMAKRKCNVKDPQSNGCLRLWLERLKRAAQRCNCEYLIVLESDSIVEHMPKTTPPHDAGGVASVRMFGEPAMWTQELMSDRASNWSYSGNGMCGGSYVRTEAFLNVMNTSHWYADIEEMHKLDKRIGLVSDATLAALMMNAGYTLQPWDDVQQTPSSQEDDDYLNEHGLKDPAIWHNQKRHYGERLNATDGDVYVRGSDGSGAFGSLASQMDDSGPYGIVHIPKTAGASFARDTTRFVKSEESWVHQFNCKVDLPGQFPDGNWKCDELCFNDPFLHGAKHIVFLREPRSHVLSQYLECKYDQWGIDMTKNTEFPGNSEESKANVTDGFEAWVRHFSEPDYEGDFQCYNPRNMQSRALLCTKDSHHVEADVPEPTTTESLSVLKTAFMVGITGYYQESMCLFLFKKEGKLRPFCDCKSPAAWATFTQTHETHSVPKHSVSELAPAVQTLVDAVTRVDRLLYKKGLARFRNELKLVYKTTGVRVMCPKKPATTEAGVSTAGGGVATVVGATVAKPCARHAALAAPTAPYTPVVPVVPATLAAPAVAAAATALDWVAPAPQAAATATATATTSVRPSLLAAIEELEDNLRVTGKGKLSERVSELEQETFGETTTGLIVDRVAVLWDNVM